MTDSINIYFKYLSIMIRSQLQYKASFFMMTLGHFAITFVEIIGIVILFDRFKSLDGWQLHEVAVMYGIVNCSFAISEGIGRGFDTFSVMVKSGDFDRYLLRPRSTALQVAVREVELMRIGRLLQGIIVLIWGISQVDMVWGILHYLLLLYSILAGACLFYGLLVIQATVSFWTIESLELMNIVTYGGVEAGQYPITIYKSWFRNLFIFVIPYAAVIYFPALVLLGRDDTLLNSPIWFSWTSPIIGVLFLVIALKFWHFGVRHYRSTGS